MPIPSLKNRTRSLATAATAFLLTATSAYTDTINPFAKFGGGWVGNGLLYLSNNTKEKIRCRGPFIVSEALNASNLKLELTCAGDAYNFKLQSDINSNNGVLSGTWSEMTRGFNGKISGTIKDDRIQAVAEGQTFTATLNLVVLNDKQQITIASPGSEITDVLIGLNRSAK
jgi:hypothetical protein